MGQINSMHIGTTSQHVVLCSIIVITMDGQLTKNGMHEMKN